MEFVPKQFHFLQVNACSLTSEKAHVIAAAAIEHDCSAICISELGHRRALSGWKCITATDTFTQSGIFIRHGIHAEKIPIPELPDNSRIGWQAVSIRTVNGNPLVLIHVYFP